LGARTEFGVGHLFWVVRGFVTVADSRRWARARLSYIRYRNWLRRSLWARLAPIRYRTPLRRPFRARLAPIRYRTPLRRLLRARLAPIRDRCRLRQSLRARLLVFMTYPPRRHNSTKKCHPTRVDSSLFLFLKHPLQHKRDICWAFG
jgi:hypothetical protein